MPIISISGSFLPSLGRRTTTVYSGRGSQHCYGIMWISGDLTFPVTTGSTARAASRGQEARGAEIITRDSVHRSDPSGPADRFDPDPASLSYQATALDLQRVWHRDTQQRRAPLRPGRAAAREEAGLDSWAEPQSQSRSEESVQECRHRGRCQGGTV
jgi:hypothetical protein